MQVQANHLMELLDKAKVKVEGLTGSKVEAMNPDFFDLLAKYMNLEPWSRFEIKGSTLYKQYYLKIRGYKEGSKKYIGIDTNYLISLSHFNCKCPYFDAGIPLDLFLDDTPEFPPNHPSNPATPTYPISFNKVLSDIFLNNSKTEFSIHTVNLLKKIKNNKNIEIGENTIWIKDESINPTGTHKDRMAWEIYLWYKKTIRNQLNNPNGEIELKHLSLISYGSAAFAIQDMLQKRGLPSLCVLMDKSLDEKVGNSLKKNGANVYISDLTNKIDSTEILKRTENIAGIDLTFDNYFKSLRDVYYDHMAYEILGQNPNFVFIPFGTGDLFKNILSYNCRELDKEFSSKRYFGNKKVLSECNFFGAGNNRFASKMKMLYSPFQKSVIKNTNTNFVNKFITKKQCGNKTGVFIVEEEYVESAMEIADHFNITCEASSISGLSLFLQMATNNEITIRKDEKIIIVNTGKCKYKKSI